MSVATYISQGTFRASNNALSGVTWGTHQAGDMGLLVVTTANQAIATPSGWTLIGAVGTGTGGVAGGVMVRAYYRFAASGAEPAVAVADSGSFTAAQIFVYRGVNVSQPIHAFATGTQAATTSIALPTLTTTRDGCEVVSIIALDADANDTSNVDGWTNGDLVGLTELVDRTVNTAVGGGFAVATGYKETAGAIGSTTATGDAATAMAYLVIALTPDVDMQGEGAYANCWATGSLETGVSLAATADVTVSATAPAPTLTVVVPITIYANLGASVVVGPGGDGTAALDTSITLASATPAGSGSASGSLDARTGFLADVAASVLAVGLLVSSLPLAASVAVDATGSGTLEAPTLMAAEALISAPFAEGWLETGIHFAADAPVVATASSPFLWEATEFGSYAAIDAWATGGLSTAIEMAGAATAAADATGTLETGVALAGELAVTMTVAADLEASSTLAASVPVTVTVAAPLESAITFAATPSVTSGASATIRTGLSLAANAPVTVTAVGDIEAPITLAANAPVVVSVTGYVGTRMPSAVQIATSDYIVRVPAQPAVVHIPPEMWLLRVPKQYQPMPFEVPTARPTPLLTALVSVRATVAGDLQTWRPLRASVPVTVTATLADPTLGGSATVTVTAVLDSLPLAADVAVTVTAEGDLLTGSAAGLLVEDGDALLLEDGDTMNEE